jgi:hypothetical protein
MSTVLKDTSMVTTPELRSQFESAFSKIVRSLGPEVQKKWGGTMTWKDDRSYPEIQSELIREFSPQARSAYVSLLNKLSRGRI